MNHLKGFYAPKSSTPRAAPMTAQPLTEVERAEIVRKLGYIQSDFEQDAFHHEDPRREKELNANASLIRRAISLIEGMEVQGC
jgi:hypothetical protein